MADFIWSIYPRLNAALNNEIFLRIKNLIFILETFDVELTVVISA